MKYTIEISTEELDVIVKRISSALSDIKISNLDDIKISNLDDILKTQMNELSKTKENFWKEHKKRMEELERVFGKKEED